MKNSLSERDKSNICRLLEVPLSEKGFNVINKQKCVPFPSNGHQNCFHIIASFILEARLKKFKTHLP